MTAQELYLQLIETGGQWNAFDGPAIAQSLRTHRDCWRAIVFCDLGFHRVFDLEGKVTGIKVDYGVLRGLPDNTLFLDTLRITPSAGHEGQLEALAAGWEADTIKWHSFDDASSAHPYRQDTAAFVAAGFDPAKAVLEVWWD
jgi:hypothetical protein